MHMWSSEERRKVLEPIQLPSAIKYSTDRSSPPWARPRSRRSTKKFASRSMPVRRAFTSTSSCSWMSTRRKDKLLRSTASSTIKWSRESKSILKRTQIGKNSWKWPEKRSCGLLRPLSIFSEGILRQLSTFVTMIESAIATM